MIKKLLIAALLVCTFSELHCWTRLSSAFLRVRRSVASIAICVAIVTPIAHAKDLTTGSALFNQNCAFCHMQGVPDFLGGVSILSSNTLKSNVPAIVQLIKEGKGIMPKTTKLSNEELNSIATYVLETAASEGWDK